MSDVHVLTVNGDIAFRHDRFDELIAQRSDLVGTGFEKTGPLLHWFVPKGIEGPGCQVHCPVDLTGGCLVKSRLERFPGGGILAVEGVSALGRSGVSDQLLAVKFHDG